MADVPKPVYEIFSKNPDGPDLLFMGPTTQCVCGCDLFHALIWFDDDRSIAGYFTEGCCASCGAIIRLATQEELA